MTKWANTADCGLPPFSRFPPLSVFYQQKPDKAITSEAVLVQRTFTGTVLHLW